jgi:membrane protein DedA with SNARE-associated domain
MFASVLSVAHNLGYPALVLLVMLESGGGPLPGETALITAAVLASQHRLQIALVIALAAAAAIIGDNVGYLIGRKGGRWLLTRPGPFSRHRARVLEVGEPFFARHGSKAVFLGRWILGLRTWASWLAGASHMPWRSFSLWNAAGGITWATTIGLVAYYAGHSATGTIALFGVAGLTSTLAAPGALLARRRRRRRRQAPAPPPGPVPGPERERRAHRVDKRPGGGSCRPQPPTAIDLSRSDGGEHVRPPSAVTSSRFI